MTEQDKKELSCLLIEAMDREDLHTGQAARFLNLNPMYVSMARSEKSWKAIGAAPWVRIEEWARTRQKLSEFKIPEGEEIWVRPQKDETKGEHKPQAAAETVSVTEPLKFDDTGVLVSKEQFAQYSDYAQRLQALEKQTAYFEKATEYLIKENEALSRPMPPVQELHPLTGVQRTNLAIDIEINLVINGQRVRI